MANPNPHSFPRGYTEAEAYDLYLEARAEEHADAIRDAYEALTDPDTGRFYSDLDGER